MPPAQAVDFEDRRQVLLLRDVPWILAGRIEAQPVIAEPGRHALLAQQGQRIVEVRQIDAHADAHGEPSLLPHPDEGAHAGRPIRQVANAGDAQRVSLLLPMLDHPIFFFRCGQRHHFVHRVEADWPLGKLSGQLSARVFRDGLSHVGLHVLRDARLLQCRAVEQRRASTSAGDEGTSVDS